MVRQTGVETAIFFVNFQRSLEKWFSLTVPMLLNVKLRQPHGSGTKEPPVRPQFCLLGFYHCSLVMLFGFRGFALILIEPREVHVAGVNLGVWLRRIYSLFQLIAKNMFGFTISPLLLVHSSESMADLVHIRGINALPQFSHCG